MRVLTRYCWIRSDSAAKSCAMILGSEESTRTGRERQGEGRAGIPVGELARKQRPPVRAAHVGNVFLEEVFLDHVGEHVEKALRGAGHVPREFGDALLVHVEDAFLLQLAFFP